MRRLFLVLLLATGCSARVGTGSSASSSSTASSAASSAASSSGSTSSGSSTGTSGSASTGTSGSSGSGGGTSTGGSACTGSTALFCDDYLGSALAGAYTTHHGSWSRSAGAYDCADAVAWERARATLAADDTDFDVTVQGASAGDSGLGLVYAASASGDDGFAVLVHPAQFQGVYLKRLNPGAADTDLAHVALPSPRAGQPLTLRVQRTGARVQVWLDGAPMLDASDNAPGAHGRLGLIVSTTDQALNAGARFTLLRVDSATTWAEPDAGWFVPTTRLSQERGNNTSASPLFTDDYTNYATSAQSGNSNGDAVPGPDLVADVSRGVVSKVPLRTLLNPGAATQLFVETQTWFCHLASNEAPGTPVRNQPDARCGSHIDIGYNSDDPVHVTRAIDDLLSRGFQGVIMDWTGREKGGTYPTGTGQVTGHSRSSTEVSTNAIFAYMAEIDARPTGTLTFAVLEDEGITNCRNGWAGGCACWPAYGASCDVTSQVISDLNYIHDHWAPSPSYLRVGGEEVVLYFSPDYNACPDPGDAAHCQHIDWSAVAQHAPAGQRWFFENKGGLGHARSAGAFAWLPVPALYPGGDPSFGVSFLQDFDGYVTSGGQVGAGQSVFGSAFKGFDDGVTNGWTYSPTQNHTRYINQRCGLTWLDTFATDDGYFDTAGKPALEYLQVATWDDYEEATEIETGIDNCVQALTASAAGQVLSWSIAFGASLTDPSITGSEDTVDHYAVLLSNGGDALMQLGPDLGRDASGALPHHLDLAPFALPSGRYTVYVEAVGRPSIYNALSGPATLTVP